MFIKYIQCPLCGKQLMNQSYWIVMDNENEFYCDDCQKNIIVETNDNFIIEEAN